MVYSNSDVTLALCNTIFVDVIVIVNLTPASQ